MCSLANKVIHNYHIRYSREIFQLGKKLKSIIKRGEWIDSDLKREVSRVVLNIQKDIARESINQNDFDKLVLIKK